MCMCVIAPHIEQMAWHELWGFEHRHTSQQSPQFWLCRFQHIVFVAWSKIYTKNKKLSKSIKNCIRSKPIIN